MTFLFICFIVMLLIGIASTVINNRRNKRDRELALKFKKAQLEKMRFENEQKKLELEKYKK